jgi:ABC-2 type transport system ATP-binding protein
MPVGFKRTVQNIYFRLSGRKMRWSALRFEIHLTDKCNLNCAGCLHFSSLCDEADFLDISEYEKDLQRISQLTEGKIADIRILGGEPLLHPEVNVFLELTRKYFRRIGGGV